MIVTFFFRPSDSPLDTKHRVVCDKWEFRILKKIYFLYIKTVIKRWLFFYDFYLILI